MRWDIRMIGIWLAIFGLAVAAGLVWQINSQRVEDPRDGHWIVPIAQVGTMPLDPSGHNAIYNVQNANLARYHTKGCEEIIVYFFLAEEEIWTEVLCDRKIVKVDLDGDGKVEQ